MKKTFNYIFTCILVMLSLTLVAQEKKVTGFWEIKKVTVGSENMTPIAKWTKINADGTFQSSNGWLQNSSGTWKYDSTSHTYSSFDSLGIEDEFGGFNVYFEEEHMIWNRNEDGMSVKVTLSPIHMLPMAPGDYLVGIWDLVEITENGQSILSDFDSSDSHKMFFRWDRIYRNFSPAGEPSTGYWHIHGHRSRITLIPVKECEKSEIWAIEVDGKTLKMTGLSDHNKMIQRIYVRQNTF